MTDRTIVPGRTAVLVIHGIGQQNPFEALDAFARALWSVLNEKAGRELEARHEILPVEGGQKHFISILDPADESTRLDLHEYYWAHKMSGEITLAEIVDWLLKVSDGARRFYDENVELRKEYEAMGADALGEDGRFRPRWYLRHVGWVLRGLGFLRHMRFGAVKFLDPVIRGLMKQATRLIVDFVGDIAIYTTADAKAKHYEVRTEILNEAVQRLTSLLQEYDRVLVVGHSLGSVIAYDTLNRINLAMNAKQIDSAWANRITGLVTFGSPLDKIAFFFREHSKDEQYIRRQILAHLHSFKGKDLDLQEEMRTIGNPVTPYLDGVRWLNFWDSEDPVSGQLDFYDIAPGDNIHCEMGEPWGLAHTAYWKHEPMFQTIVKEFLQA